jgi:nucleoside-diphosphate-sugar epimerase
MRVLILGGTKFIGPHVVRRLAERGHDVTLFHRGETEADLPTSVRHVHGDFSEFANHVDQLRALSPEVVLDMVPFREEDAQRLKSFRGVARRVVAISSGDVYRAFGRLLRTEPGPPDSIPLTEDSPLRKKLSHAGLEYNKTAVERALISDPDLSATILRLPATHGPGDQQHRLFKYIKRMDDQRTFILLDEALAKWQWARGYVEDVALAIALAVMNEQASNRVYNVADPTALTEAEWVRQIARVHGWRGEVIALPSEQLPPGLRSDAFDLSQQYVVDTCRIRRELGYSEGVSFDEALRRTIEWERAHPPEKVDPEQFDYAAEDATLTKSGSIT